MLCGAKKSCGERVFGVVFPVLKRIRAGFECSRYGVRTRLMFRVWVSGVVPPLVVPVAVTVKG